MIHISTFSKVKHKYFPTIYVKLQRIKEETIFALNFINDHFEVEKSHDPDDAQVFFFKKFLGVVATNVFDVAKEFFSLIILLKYFNANFIFIIPNTFRAELVDSFKPISLCNSIYKIFTEVLPSHLMEIIPLIIKYLIQ